MANVIYPSAKEMLLSAQLNWLSDPIYAILIDTTHYTYSANHTSLADVDSEAFVTSSPYLTGKTVLNGAADADDLTFPAATGAVCAAMILVKDGGTALQSKLIAYIDYALGLPYTPEGKAVVFQWDDGPNRVLHL